MKKSLLTILICALSFSAFSQYVSIFGDSTQYWKVYNYRFLLGAEAFADSIWINGDSIINNINYKKLFSQERNNVSGNNLEPYGFLREDTTQGKVWFINNGFPSGFSIENLVYDLSLTVGDTMPIINGSNSSLEHTLTVDSVYFINGKKHLKLFTNSTIPFELSYLNDPNYSYPYDSITFIEGVGSTRGFDNRIDNRNNYGRQASNRLLCNFRNNNQEYQHELKGKVPFLNDCDTLDLIVGLQEHIINKLSIAPNPTNTIINITSAQGLERIEVYDIKGTSTPLGNLQNLNFEQSREAQIDLTNFQNGIYFLKIHFENGEVVVKKVVRN